eukprot:TRINITY_DN14675_c0_g1_i1.p1 TRINITY_DN14675_c0_g1~~TRINITY_DN14675_c0_g1_i1.p1  ORF type:complete len:232 (-),score=49.38 TRINITY_DN14675_c0_g1_i1:153-848(-)
MLFPKPILYSRQRSLKEIKNPKYNIKINDKNNGFDKDSNNNILQQKLIEDNYQAFNDEKLQEQQQTIEFVKSDQIIVKLPETANYEPNFQQLKIENPEGVEDEHEGSWINQLIETIEFVLGTISNTASYLRLWALSLAHSQLSEVFYDKGINMSLKSDSNVAVKILILLIGYFVFANFTFAVLMCMDSMECFLHALRLHWVEFQNKFYKADGYEFVPFSIEKELNQSLINE